MSMPDKKKEKRVEVPKERSDEAQKSENEESD
jgi:hypothetical protein